MEITKDGIEFENANGSNNAIPVISEIDTLVFEVKEELKKENRKKWGKELKEILVRIEKAEKLLFNEKMALEELKLKMKTNGFS